MKENISQAITNIYKINLKVKQEEKLLIFTDNYNSSLAKITRLIARHGINFTKKIIYTEYPPTGSHGAEPPQALWIRAFGRNAVKKLRVEGLLKPLLNKRISRSQLNKVKEIIKRFKNEAVDAIIALSYYSTTHTQFKYLLTKICRTRYVSMPLFEEQMLKGVMEVNWKTLAKRTMEIAKIINEAEGVEIKTPNGTLLGFSKKGRKAKADTGILTKKGSSGNLPAGEVFLAPLEGTANGRLVLEWAPTRKLKSPIILKVKNGMVVEVKGDEEYVDFLKEKISERPENANIAELGIGTNDKAERPDNILEVEKILGTIHIAIGDNSSFGGKVSTPFHQDFVFFKPTVVLIYKDGKRKMLIKRGKLLKENFLTGFTQVLDGGERIMNEIVVFITTSSEEEAVKIAHALVETRLAGCVNIIKNVRSIYLWQGKIEDEPEVLMIVKTRKELFDSLSKKVKELHSYTTPEVIALPIIEGSEEYLKWLNDVTGKK